MRNAVKWLLSSGGVLVPGIPVPGTVARYTMDSITGSTVVDDIGNYDAIKSGAVSTVAGVSGSALDFANSSGQQLDTGIVSWAPSGLTFSIWLKLDAISTTAGVYPSVVSSRGATGTTGFFVYQSPAINSSEGHASFRAHLNTSTGLISFDTDFTVVAGVWNHLSILYTAGGTLRVKINDVLDANQSAVGGSIVATAQSLWIGRCRRETWIDGQVDIVNICDTEITDAENTQLYGEAA